MFLKLYCHGLGPSDLQCVVFRQGHRVKLALMHAHVCEREFAYTQMDPHNCLSHRHQRQSKKKKKKKTKKLSSGYLASLMDCGYCSLVRGLGSV